MRYCVEDVQMRALAPALQQIALNMLDTARAAIVDILTESWAWRGAHEATVWQGTTRTRLHLG
jgi:hypothetical protein